MPDETAKDKEYQGLLLESLVTGCAQRGFASSSQVKLRL